MSESSRLSCLEFYCRLRQAPLSSGVSKNAASLFSIEEDHRKRMYVQVDICNADRSKNVGGNTGDNLNQSNRGDKSREDFEISLNNNTSLMNHSVSSKQWRLTYGLKTDSTNADVTDTLGSCMLDWVLDGFNALCLSMGTANGGKSFTLYGGEPVHTIHNHDYSPKPQISISSTKSSGIIQDFLVELFNASAQPTKNFQKNSVHSYSNSFSGDLPALSSLLDGNSCSSISKIGLSYWDVRGEEIRDLDGKLINQDNGRFAFDTFEAKNLEEALAFLDKIIDVNQEFNTDQGSSALGRMSSSVITSSPFNGPLGSSRSPKRITNRRYHTFFRIAVFHRKTNVVSTIHFVDLANRDDLECRRDLEDLEKIIMDITRSSAEKGGSLTPLGTTRLGSCRPVTPVTPTIGGNIGNTLGGNSTSNNSPTSSPFNRGNCLAPASSLPDLSTIDPLQLVFNDSRPILKILVPLISGNCKTFLIANVMESMLSKREVDETMNLLSIAEAASLNLSVNCERVIIDTYSPGNSIKFNRMPDTVMNMRSWAVIINRREGTNVINIDSGEANSSREGTVINNVKNSVDNVKNSGGNLNQSIERSRERLEQAYEKERSMSPKKREEARGQIASSDSEEFNLSPDVKNKFNRIYNRGVQNRKDETTTFDGSRQATRPGRRADSPGNRRMGSPTNRSPISPSKNGSNPNSPTNSCVNRNESYERFASPKRDGKLARVDGSRRGNESRGNQNTGRGNEDTERGNEDTGRYENWGRPIIHDPALRAAHAAAYAHSLSPAKNYDRSISPDLPPLPPVLRDENGNYERIERDVNDRNLRNEQDRCRKESRKKGEPVDAHISGDDLTLLAQREQELAAKDLRMKELGAKYDRPDQFYRFYNDTSGTSFVDRDNTANISSVRGNTTNLGVGQNEYSTNLGGGQEVDSTNLQNDVTWNDSVGLNEKDMGDQSALLEEVLDDNRRMKSQLDSLSKSKTSDVDHQILLQKYKRALSHIDTLTNNNRRLTTDSSNFGMLLADNSSITGAGENNTLAEAETRFELATMNEQLHEREIEVQSLRLEIVELKSQLRTAACERLLSLDILGQDASRSPYILFDDYEKTITDLQDELSVCKERNARLCLELDKYNGSFTNYINATSTEGMLLMDFVAAGSTTSGGGASSTNTRATTTGFGGLSGKSPKKTMVGSPSRRTQIGPGLSFDSSRELCNNNSNRLTAMHNHLPAPSTLNGLPKFLRDLFIELHQLRNRDSDYTRSERSNKLTQKCIFDMSQKLKAAETQLKKKNEENALLHDRVKSNDIFMDKVLLKAKKTEDELDIEREKNEDLDREIAALKHACFHHTKWKRHEDLLTKFIQPGLRPTDPGLSKSIGGNYGGNDITSVSQAVHGFAANFGTNSQGPFHASQSVVSRSSRALSQGAASRKLGFPTTGSQGMLSNYNAIADLDGANSPYNLSILNSFDPPGRGDGIGGGGAGRSVSPRNGDSSDYYKNALNKSANKQLLQAFDRMHRTIVSNEQMKALIPLSSRVKAGLDSLTREHAKLHTDTYKMVNVVKKSIYDRVSKSPPPPNVAGRNGSPLADSRPLFGSGPSGGSAYGSQIRDISPITKDPFSTSRASETAERGRSERRRSEANARENSVRKSARNRRNNDPGSNIEGGVSMNGNYNGNDMVEGNHYSMDNSTGSNRAGNQDTQKNRASVKSIGEGIGASIGANRANKRENQPFDVSMGMVQAAQSLGLNVDDGGNKSNRRSKGQAGKKGRGRGVEIGS